MKSSDKRLMQKAIDWNSSIAWDNFGTLTFRPRCRLREEEAQRIGRYFWKEMSRAAFGQNPNYRVERLVFNHYGKDDDYLHFHFVAKSPIEPKRFSICTNAIWAGIDILAAPPSCHEILPIINSWNAVNYGWHEFWRSGTDSLNIELSHINGPRLDGKGPVLPHAEAEARLAAKMDPYWERKAEAEYPFQLARALQRNQKRHTK